MFSLDDTIPENFNDEIGSVLKQITQIKTNTKIRQELVSEVINIGKKQKYIFLQDILTDILQEGLVNHSFTMFQRIKKETLRNLKGKLFVLFVLVLEKDL